MEHTVLTRHFETVKVIVAADTHFQMVERDPGFIAFSGP